MRTNQRTVRRSVGRSVGCSQGNTAVPIPHSQIQEIERELAPSWRTLHYCLLALLIWCRYRSRIFRKLSDDDSELRVERPNTRLEQSSGRRGGRVCRPSPPDCTHLGTRGRRSCYTRHGRTYGDTEGARDRRSRFRSWQCTDSGLLVRPDNPRL